MPFPTTERVIYECNPLEQVISQVRFPPILRITADQPVDLQEAIRDTYPVFDKRPIVQVPREVPEPPGPGLSISFGSAIVWDFSTLDGCWTVSLTNDFVALTCRQYERWEEFQERFEPAFQGVQEIYRPAVVSRTGLRYRDVIRRSALSLSDAPWSELLRPEVTGELASPDVASEVVAASHEVLIQLPEEIGQVRIRHGLGTQSGSGEACYIIDSDFFTEERMAAADVIERLRHFNRRAGHLFRWCITEKLHSAMRPQPVPPAGN